MPVTNSVAREYHCTIDLLFDWFGISCMLTIFVFICKTD
jgi:hypothetical protein